MHAFQVPRLVVLCPWYMAQMIMTLLLRGPHLLQLEVPVVESGCKELTHGWEQAEICTGRNTKPNPRPAIPQDGKKDYLLE